MKYTYYSATRKSIFYVKYKCVKCDTVNIQKQELLTSDDQRADGWCNNNNYNAKYEKAKAFAKSISLTDARKEMDNIVSSIQKHKYRKANFHCKCSRCGYKPVWSRFYRGLPIKISVISFIVFLLLLLQDLPISKNYICLWGAVFVCAPLMIQLIQYLFIIVMVKKMSPDYLPVCSCNVETLSVTLEPSRVASYH